TFTKKNGMWRDADILRHHTSPIRAIRFVEHDKTAPLISLDANGMECVWALGSGKLIDRISAHKGMGFQLNLDRKENVTITTGIGQSGAELSIAHRKRENEGSLKNQTLIDGDYSLCQLPQSKKVCVVSDKNIACYNVAGDKIVWKRDTGYKY